jgi:hypothetical protein
MIQFLKNLFQRKQPRLPTVPEFLQCGINFNDTFILNKPDLYCKKTAYAGYSDKYPDYPVGTKNSIPYSKKGWYCVDHEGRRDCTHIIRIERNGKIVAQGQVYDK